MKVKLGTAGEPWPNGIVVLPGAMKMKADSVPVTLGFDLEDVVGTATNLREEGRGIYVDVEFNPDFRQQLVEFDDDGVASMFDANPFVQPFVIEPEKTLKEGTLREVFLTTKIEGNPRP